MHMDFVVSCPWKAPGAGLVNLLAGKGDGQAGTLYGILLL